MTRVSASTSIHHSCKLKITIKWLIEINFMQEKTSLWMVKRDQFIGNNDVRRARRWKMSKLLFSPWRMWEICAPVQGQNLFNWWIRICFFHETMKTRSDSQTHCECVSIAFVCSAHTSCRFGSSSIEFIVAISDRNISN